MQLIASDKFSYWGGDKANYGISPTSDSEVSEHDDYTRIIDQCEFEVLDISRTMDSIQYSSFFKPAQNEWENEEGEWEGDEEGDYELHDAVLNALYSALRGN